MIVIKDRQVLREVLCGFDAELIEIVCAVFDDNDIIVITSGYRKGDRGVHGTAPCRGIDLRSWVYQYPEDVVREINAVWEYDPNRPEKQCALYHATKSGVKHIHLQTHPNTRLRICGVDIKEPFK